MSLFRSVLEILTPEQKKKAMPWAWNTGNRYSITPRTNSETAARGTVYSCIRLRAEAIAATNFSILENGKPVLAGHWADELLKNPNYYYTRSQIFGIVEQWLNGNGNAFIYTPLLGGNVPVQMWVLDSTRVQIIQGDDGRVIKYKYNLTNGGYKEIPENEVIHLANLRAHSPAVNLVGMPVFGYSLVEAAGDYTGIDFELSAYLQRFFRDDALPPLIVENPETMDKGEYDLMKTQWNENLPSYKLRAMLTNGMKLAVPPDSNLALGYSDISRDVRIQIQQVFGIPPGILDGNFQNRATAEVQYSIFHEQTINPRKQYIAEEITRHFRRWGKFIEVTPDLYTYRDPESIRKQEEHDLSNGIRTINDIRRERGLNTVNGGDVVYVKSGLVPLEIANQGNAAPVNIQLGRSVPDDEEQRAAVFRDMSNLTIENEKLFGAELEQILDELVNAANQAVEDGTPAAFEIDRADFQQKIDKAIRRAMQQILDGIGEPGSNLEGEFGQYMKSLAFQMESQIFVSVGGITDKIREVISVNADQPKSVIQDAILRAIDGIRAGQARAIAQTASNYITTNVQKTIYTEKSIEYNWLTRRDNRVRDSHREMDRARPDPAGLFTMPSGHKTPHPCGPGLDAEEAINCRCVLFPVRK